MNSIILRSAAGAAATWGLACLLLCTAACSDRRTLAEQAAARHVEIRTQIREIVAEPMRAEVILGVLDEWDVQVAQRQKTEADVTLRLATLNADYDASIEAFKTLYAERQASDLKFIRQAVEMRSKLVAATTPAEWEQLAKIRAELRPPATAAIHGAQQ